MPTLEFMVLGRPAPQGSKRWLPNRRMVEHNPRTRLWRSAVVDAAVLAADDAGLADPMAGAVLAEVTFCFRRPRSHYGTGRNANVIKQSAPGRFHTQRPDGDKLTRALFDALTTAGVIHDDAIIAQCQWVKWWGDRDYMAVELWNEP